MKHALWLALLIVLVASAAFAQPVVQEGAALNIGSFAFASLPNGSLPQGGMFAVFGAGVGPAQLVQVGDFPLPTELGGFSVQVAVGGATVDCLMIFAVSTQLAAILPSNTPLGDGTLIVTADGQASTPIAVRVVANSFGIFARNQGGSGPGIVQNVISGTERPVNALNQAASPGMVMILWGTGLGAASGDEAAGPLPADMPELDVQVFVGGIQAQITYRGRSGCCAAIDQIVFTIPPGVVGCYLPVVVVVNGVPSNTVTISVAEDGTVCSDAGGITSDHIATAEISGSLRLGRVDLHRDTLQESTGGGFPVVELDRDTARARFREFTLAQLLATQSAGGLSMNGACRVWSFRGVNPILVDPVPGAPLEAGAEVMVTGPLGTKMVARTGPGNYDATLGGGGLIPGLGDPPFLMTGDYTASNPGGGAGVGVFNAIGEITDGITWDNAGSFDVIDRSGSVTVNWSGDLAAGQYVSITGFSGSNDNDNGAAFECREAAEAGSFAIPAYVVGSLPVSEDTDMRPTGRLAVGAASNLGDFPATGLHTGKFRARDLTIRVVNYQ